jgi:hypothetical protein
MTDMGQTNWTSGQMTECSQMSTTGDQTTNLRCFYDNADAQMILTLPAGTFNFNQNGDVLTLDRSEVLFRGAGPGNLVTPGAGATILQMNAGTSTVQRLANGVGGGPVTGPSVTWSAGYTAGDTILTTSGDNSSITSPGWVRLSSAASAWEEGDPAQYTVRVLCRITSGGSSVGSDCTGVSNNQIKIDRGLPSSRVWGTSATMTALTFGAEKVGFEDMAFVWDVAEDLAFTCGGSTTGSQTMLIENLGEFWLDNVQFANGWKRIFEIKDTARFSMRNSAIGEHNYAKQFDHEMFQILERNSDLTIESNFFRQAGQGLTFTTDSIRLIFAYNHINDAEDEPLHDLPQDPNCTGSGTPWSCCTGSGTGTCGAAECDDDGEGGTNVNRTDLCTNSIFHHNKSGSGAIYERNVWQCPPLVDHNNVPGGWITFFGNRGEGDGYLDGGGNAWQAESVPPDTNANSRFLGSARAQTVGGAPTASEYRTNWLYFANHVNNMSGPINMYTQNFVSSDNVIRGSCEVDDDGTGDINTSSQCSEVNGSEHVVTPQTWENNDMGLSKTGSRTMPSSLYMTESEWNAFITEQGGTGTAPWVGADVDTFTGSIFPYTPPATCLPAKEKWTGGC